MDKRSEPLQVAQAWPGSPVRVYLAHSDPSIHHLLRHLPDRKKWLVNQRSIRLQMHLS